MKKLSIIFIFGILIILTWCTKFKTVDIDYPILTWELEEISDSWQNIEIDMTDKNQVIEFAITALKTKNIEQLQKTISSDWVRFSPYSYIDTDRNIILQNNEILAAFNSDVDYVRWNADWSWLPILMTFKNYINRYVYDVDFQKLAERNYDKIVQRWNTINNIEDIYTWLSTIEFFVPGINPEYEGMDRRSLTFVLKQENNERKIKAIVHSEWTI